MPLINCEFNFILTWSVNCAICKADRAINFKIIDTKILNKYQSRVSTQTQNQYLDYLIDPTFKGVNRHFVLSFEDNAFRTGHTEYFLPKVEIKIIMSR